MDLKPKTNPESPNNLAETSISELFSFLRSDVDRVEHVLLARYAKLRAEIGPLQEKVEMERLMRLQAQHELKKKEELCQKGKRVQENNEKLLKESKKRGLRDKSTIEELRNKNLELERENLKLKKKWADDRKAVAELRIRVTELEDAKKKNLETIGKLRAENCKLVHLDLGNSKRKPRTPFQRIKEIRHSLAASASDGTVRIYLEPDYVRGEAIDPSPLKEEGPHPWLVYTRRRKEKGKGRFGNKNG